MAVTSLLEQAADAESLADLQYRCDWQAMEIQGYSKLAARFAHEAEEERGHWARFVRRLRELGVVPLITVRETKAVTDVVSVLQNQLVLEQEAVALYSAAVEECREAGDPTSRKLFEDILGDEEQHVIWLRAQLAQIDAMGIEGYLQTVV